MNTGLLLKRLEALEARSDSRGFRVHFAGDGEPNYPAGDHVLIIEFCEGLPESAEIDIEPTIKGIEHQGISDKAAYDDCDE